MPEILQGFENLRPTIGPAGRNFRRKDDQRVVIHVFNSGGNAESNVNDYVGDKDLFSQFSNTSSDSYDPDAAVVEMEATILYALSADFFLRDSAASLQSLRGLRRDRPQGDETSLATYIAGAQQANEVVRAFVESTETYGGRNSLMPVETIADAAGPVNSETSPQLIQLFDSIFSRIDAATDEQRIPALYALKFLRDLSVLDIPFMDLGDSVHQQVLPTIEMAAAGLIKYLHAKQNQ
ncbi:MAG: hypothetical protein ACREGI_03095, partial [Candidatus Levyibacteriota bacterium]